MTKYKEWESVGQFDVLVGGTPCQSFSVAGLRKGLDDPRGNLMLTFGAIADHFKPTWIVWENVPGVLSSNGGRDFGSFLGMLGKLGYGFAYRICDAEYFGVAQRRRRVFVVGYFGDWRRAAQVLFDAESLSGNPAPSRETRKGIAFNAQGSACQGLSVGEITPTLDKSKTPAVMCLMDQGGSVMNIETDITGTLRSQTKGHEPVIMSTGQGNAEITEGHAPTLNCNHEAPILALAGNTIVRRLTPRECERLQGFPGDWTRIPWRGASAENCPDGPRYKACGNSMAVPVMRWIGKRIIGLTTAST